MQSSAIESLASGMTHEDGAASWKPPLSGCLKINTDGTVFTETNSHGFGLVVRDENGLFVAGRIVLLAGIVDPIVAEFMRLKEALSWVKTMAWHNVTIEFDCLVVV